MGIPVTDAYIALKAMSNAPYTTMSALAELIDNSLQAKAEYIALIAQDGEARTSTGRKINRLKTLAVYDDGEGMDKETIESALAVGFSRNKEDNKGIGKFGYGLTVGSLSQAKRVEVYSWRKKGEYLYTYIDMDELRTTGSQNLPDLTRVDELPIIGGHKWDTHLTPGESGTLIVWDEIYRTNIRTSAGIINRFSHDLSRIYRHFLDDDNTYGKKRNIEILHLNEDSTIHDRKPLLPNDPLYLLTPNTLPDKNLQNEATNEKLESILYQAEYLDENGDIKTSEVEIIFSMVKPSIRALGGGSRIGQHYARNQGISFVRAEREIKLDGFGWLRPQEERHRWVGVEVRFEPALDHYFGVTNDKQNVSNMKAYDDSNPQPELFEGEKMSLDYKFYNDMHNHLRDNIRIIAGDVKKQREGTRTKDQTSPEAKANKKLSENNEKTATEAETSAVTKAQATKEHEAIIKEKDGSISDEDAKEIAKTKVDWKIDLIKDSWPGTQFMETSIVGKTFQIRINTDTKFFDVFYSHLEDIAENDTKSLDAMKMVLMGYAMAEDTLRNQIDPERKVFGEIYQKWGQYVNDLIPIAND